MTDQITEVRAIAHGLLRAFPEGAPTHWSDGMQITLNDALRLAELAAELLPMLQDAVVEGAKVAIDAHEQINGMQTNLERIGEGEN